MDYDDKNPFALILRGEIPATVVDENEHTLTFMDIMPKAPGHVLVIPKHPSPNLFEVPDSELAHVIRQVKRVAKAAKQVFPSKGVRVIQLNDSMAGQSVFHLHFHLIPSDDGMDFGFHGSGQGSAEEIKSIAEAYRVALASID